MGTIEKIDIVQVQKISDREEGGAEAHLGSLRARAWAQPSAASAPAPEPEPLPEPERSLLTPPAAMKARFMSASTCAPLQRASSSSFTDCGLMWEWENTGIWRRCAKPRSADTLEAGMLAYHRPSFTK